MVLQGAAVLRMLSDFLSEEVFVQGLTVCPDVLCSRSHVHLCPGISNSLFCVQSYLKEFAYKNTVGTDLWRHLQMVRVASIPA